MAPRLTMTRISLRSLLFTSLLTTSGVLGAVTPRQDASGSEECVVESANDLAVDDSAAILDTFKRCSSDSTIRFNPTNYTVYTPISLTGLSKWIYSIAAHVEWPSLPSTLIGNVKVLFYGNWLLPQNVTQVQTAINATQNPKSVRSITRLLAV